MMESFPLVVDSSEYLIQGIKETIHRSRPKSRQSQLQKYLKLKTRSLYLHQSQEVKPTFSATKPKTSKRIKGISKRENLHSYTPFLLDHDFTISPSSQMLTRKLTSSLSPKRYFTHRKRRLELKDIPSTPASFITESLVDDSRRIADVLLTGKTFAKSSRGSFILTPVGNIENTLKKEISNPRLIRLNESLKKKKNFQIKPFYPEVRKIQEPKLPVRKLSACIVITSNS
ncbi:unnamed protein product [Blepharisma stoltei]|uniref:Uncharacterized protein n=1 Tax=Blepharisma stoltei TaxID=1481888 RepID=A0AAU9J001_9CILI|nr:unnamed protein product [Blepharisma stoltei]